MNSTFQHYKNKLLEQSRNTKNADIFHDGTRPPKSGWTRYCVIEHICKTPNIDPLKMAAELIEEGIKVYFDDSSISLKENNQKEEKVLSKLKSK